MISFFQFIIIIVSVVFLIIFHDIYKRKWMHLLHFIFLLGWIVWIVYFSFYVETLNKFWQFFWIQRGADLLVYISIIILFYMLLNILNRIFKIEHAQNFIIQELALKDMKLWDTKKQSIVFVIPIYNEDTICIEVIRNVINKGFHVVCIDDGSTNGIFEHIWKAFQSDARVSIIKHAKNLWQGGALQTGFFAVERYFPDTQYVVTFDSDGQHQIEDIDVFIEAFKNNPHLDIVFWSRFLWWAINIPFLRKCILKWGIFFTRIISNIKLTDTHNGYRMIKKATLPHIRLTLYGMEHASEFIDIVKQKKLHYTEVPITILYTEYSLKKWQKIKNLFSIAWKMIYKKFFFR